MPIIWAAKRSSADEMLYSVFSGAALQTSASTWTACDDIECPRDKPTGVKMPRKKTASDAAPRPVSDVAVEAIANKLNALIAGVLAHYVKRKNCHWDMKRPYLREYHAAWRTGLRGFRDH